MSRLRRNQVVLVLGLVAVIASARVLPEEATWILSVLGMVGLGWVAWLGRHFFAARTLMAQHRWDEALLALAAFELELTRSSWKRRCSALYVGLYSQDGIAVARNALGSIRFEQGLLTEARGHFERALQQDPGYAVAAANLALVATRQGALEEAERARLRALELGLSQRTLDRLLASP